MKKEVTAWEELFSGHISDRGLVLGLYKEFSKLNSRKQTTRSEDGQTT